MKRVLAALLGGFLLLALSQSAWVGPVKVTLSPIPDVTTSPAVSVTGEVSNLPPGWKGRVRLQYQYLDPATGKWVQKSGAWDYVTFQPPAPPPPPPPPPPSSTQKTLLAEYGVKHCVGTGSNGQPVCYEIYDYSRYRPRQFSASVDLDEYNAGLQATPEVGRYAGWDVLVVTNEPFQVRVVQLPDWLRIKLNRPARVALVWRGEAPPAWLSNWARADDLGPWPVWERDFPAGEHYLPSPATWPSGYFLLLAEADGTPSRAPSYPAGQAEPNPNDTCPTWVHDQYTTTGPAGQTYPTWHPQIDPVYWCYFHHEHGSDPTLFAGYNNLPYKPAFGYASQKAGVNEAHEGFKLFAYEYSDYENGRRISALVQFHQGTAGRGRLCVRYHEIDLALADAVTGELFADLHWTSDTGFSRNVHEDDRDRFKPAECPGNPDLINDPAYPNIMGRRNIPLINALGYESWQPSWHTRIGTFGASGYIIQNPVSRCSSERDAAGYLTCDQLLFPGGDQTGEQRHLIIAGADQTPPVGRGVDAKLALGSGVFYSDPMGMEPRNQGDSDSVRQYVKPGFRTWHVTADSIFTRDAWRFRYQQGSRGSGTVRDDSAGPLNLEGALVYWKGVRVRGN